MLSKISAEEGGRGGRGPTGFPLTLGFGKTVSERLLAFIEIFMITGRDVS